MAALTAGVVVLGTLVAQAQGNFIPFAPLTISIQAYQQVTVTNTRTVGNTKIYSYTFSTKTNIINNAVILSNMAVALNVTLPTDAALMIAGTNSLNGPKLLSKAVPTPSYSIGDVVIVDQNRGNANVLYALNGSLNNNHIYVNVQNALPQTSSNARFGTKNSTGLGEFGININTPKLSYYYYGRNNAYVGYQTTQNANPQLTAGTDALLGAGELTVDDGNNQVFMPCDVKVTASQGNCPLSFFQLFTTKYQLP